MLPDTNTAVNDLNRGILPLEVLKSFFLGALQTVPLFQSFVHVLASFQSLLDDVVVKALEQLHFVFLSLT